MKILGIINVTPDSFSGGWAEPESAVEAAIKMLDAGVDAVDVGGESTRPGAQEVAEAEELERVIPVIAEIARRRQGARISVDTRKSAVARAAMQAGASMLNDVSMLMFDSKMAQVAAESGAELIIGHTRGTPENMAKLACYREVVTEVLGELTEAVRKAEAEGVPRERIIADVGLGFAKSAADNVAILRDLERFRELGVQLMVGHSRKRFIGEICEIAVPEQRDFATLGCSVWLRGRCDWVRVHRAEETVATMRLIAKLENI